MTPTARCLRVPAKVDHKIFDIAIFHGVDLNGDGDCEDNGEVQNEDNFNACYLYQTGRVPNAPGGVGDCEMAIVTENFILFGCVSKDPNAGDPELGPRGRRTCWPRSTFRPSRT